MGKLYCTQIYYSSWVPYCLHLSRILKRYLRSDKGLVTNYGEGGATKREGGAREVLPLRKGGAEKVLAMLKGGRKKFRGSFYAVA